jgi:hypothetical protein
MFLCAVIPRKPVLTASSFAFFARKKRKKTLFEVDYFEKGSIVFTETNNTVSGDAMRRGKTAAKAGPKNELATGRSIPP